MREIRTSGSEGGGIETNRCSLPLSVTPAVLRSTGSSSFAAPPYPPPRAGEGREGARVGGPRVVPFHRNPL